MKKNVITAIIGLGFCLICTGCGATSAKPQDAAIVGSASADMVSDESELYTALEELVLDYQSGDWGGWARSILNGRYLAEVHGDYIMLHACDDDLDLWMLSLVNVNLPAGRSVFDFVDSGIFTDPDGEERTYWLGEDGIYCYTLGEEIASWSISGVERGQAFLVRYEDYAPCVRVNNQIIYCMPGGETAVLTEAEK